MADSSYRVVTACRLCDSANLSVALDLGETPLANELDGTELFPLVVMRCGDCEHHQLSIAVNPERLWGPNYPYQSGTSPVFRKHLEALADEVAALVPVDNNSRYEVLEIASNDGTLVDMLNARGLQAVGVDPSGPTDPARGLAMAGWPRAAKWMDYHFGFCNPLDFQCIIALNVFAHVDDLHGFTAAVKEALAPDGVFILEVGYLPTMCERGVFDTIYHEHFSYHTLTPLQAFFKQHDLFAYRAERVESQGGSMRLYVRHRERFDGMYFKPCEGLVEKRSPDITKLRERMALTQAGMTVATKGTVAGYGCPAKLTTLVYSVGTPWAWGMQCIFDDNPLKVGRITPGMNIPIVPTSELLSRNPDTLILFSWNFASEIIPRLRAMGYRGRIVTPLPEVEIDE